MKLSNKQCKNIVAEEESVSTSENNLLEEENLTEEATEMNYYCQDCNLNFETKEELNHHIEQTHTIDENQPSGNDKVKKDTASKKEKVTKSWYCDECKVTLKTKDCYKQHMEHVHDLGTMKFCPVCKRGYKNRTSLWKHQNAKDHWIKAPE